MVAKIKKAKTGMKKVKNDVKEKKEDNKDEKKDDKKDNGNKTAPCDAEKDKLTKQAIGEVEAELAKPEVQAQGFQVLESWSKRFKPTLGAFKKFVASQADRFTICQRGDSAFVVVKKGAKPPAAFFEKEQKNQWQHVLLNAWTGYCQATPKEDRSITIFIKALPGSTHAGESGEAPEQEAKSKHENMGKKSAATKAEGTPPAKKKKVVKKKA